MDLGNSENDEVEADNGDVQLETTSSVEPNVEESDEDEMSPAKALQMLENAWLNEKFAPELLPHQFELVQCMLQQISHMEENIKK